MSFMKINVARTLWIVSTVAIMAFTVVVIGRNLMHAIKIRGQISDLETERDGYARRIEQDSTILEQLKYDEGLEQYARENFNMQKEGEKVYIFNEKAQ